MLLIGDKIQEYRRAANLTQEEFAAKVGVTRQAVSKWELDKAYPDLDKLADICEILHVSITEFLYGREEAAPGEEQAESAERTRGRSSRLRLYSMAVLLGGAFVFCAVVLAVFLMRYPRSKDNDLLEQAKVERVYRQYTKADLGIYDDVGRKVVRTLWLDADGIRQGDYIECYTNEEQNGIFYDYNIGTLAAFLVLTLLFLLLFLLCIGEISCAAKVRMTNERKGKEKS